MRSDARVARGPLGSFVVFAALTIAQGGLGIALLPVYLRHIEPDAYGILAAVMVFAAAVGSVATLKLDAAMRTYYFDHARDDAALARYLAQVCSAALWIGAAVYALALVCGPALLDLTFAHADARIHPAAALATGAAVANACLAPYFCYLRNSHRLRALALWQVAMLAATIALQLVLVVGLGYGLEGVLWGSLLPPVFALALLAARKPALLATRPDWRYLAPSLRYCVPLALLGLVYVLATRLDRVVVERYLGLDALGAYSVLLTLFGLPAIFCNALDNAVRPHVRVQPEGGRDADGRSLDRFHDLYLSVGVLGVSVAVLFGAALGLATTNGAYLAAQRWLALAATAAVPGVLLRYYALYFDVHKRSVPMTALALARSVLLAVLLFVLVPPFGVPGALLATLTTQVLHALGLLLAVRYGLRAQVSALGAMRLTVFVAVVWAIAYLSADRSVVVFGVAQLAAALSFVALTSRRALAALGVERRSRRVALAAQTPSRFE